MYGVPIARECDQDDGESVMPVCSVEGKLGTGKTKFCVWMAQQALRDGRRVASNVDLYLDKLVPEGRKSFYLRIPDKPDSETLEAIGHGNPESYDEDRNGVLILDELGTWLNARSFQDKSRAGLLDWLIHARKKGWDVYLIVQDAGMIDKQVREALIEYQCTCIRMDKVKLPFIGWLLAAIGSMLGFPRWGYLPRMHQVVARVGQGTGKIVADRWLFRGDDLHAAYDTRQIFRSDYPHGLYSGIIPRDHQPPLTLRQILRSKINALRGQVPRKRQLELRAKLPYVNALLRVEDREERFRLWRRLETVQR